ncbi:MAG: alpha-glucosidase/alpha-galactosidase [Armatimonadetes bacterium]|nr:alpha-glucosidase/alpha-galactosidase [Armatimonadota bacterium]
MPVRIAMIGAGSIGFTRRLVADILTVPELADTTFALMDISAQNLDMVAQLVRRDIQANRLPAQVEATCDQRAAVAGADYVISTIRQGGLEAFQTDIDIPLLYGVDQCVGDTLCAGGIMYGQRTIPALLSICRDIREVGQPDTLFLNYSNPMAMNTWACNQYGGVRTVGLCHGVQGAHWQIADCIARWAKRERLLPEDYRLHRKEVDVVAAGLNHQTWFIRVTWRGRDMTPLLPDLFASHPDYSRTEKVRIDVMRRFGYYSTESNGHLSEYLPWYRKRTHEIARWIDLSSWINGETGGYLRVCTEGRGWFETDYPNWLAAEPPRFTPETRSEEHGSYIIEALETGRIYRGHFNVINQGRITNLPADCCVEIPGYVDRTGINMPVVGDLPLGCAATCSASVSVQRLAVQAAVAGDVDLLKLAMLHDPLTGAVCDPEEVWQLTDHMLTAQAAWLPNYTAAIPAARDRLAEHERNGTRVKLTETQGAARLATKTLAEMQAQAAAARANAQAAGKGGMTEESAI